MLARLDPRLLERHLVPARRADEGRDARRGRARRARGRPPAREPGGVLPRRRRLPRVPRAPRASRRARARSSTRAASVLGTHRRPLGVHAGTAARARRRRCDAALRARLGRRARTRSSSGRAPSLARTRVSARGRLHMPVGRVDGEAPLPVAGGRARRSRATKSGFDLSLDEPAFGVARGQAAVLYDGRRRSSVPAWSPTRPRASRLRASCLRSRAGDVGVPRPRRLPRRRRGSRSRGRSSGSSVTFDRLSSLLRSSERELIPVISKVGGSVDRVNAQLDKLDPATDSAVDAVEASTRPCAR